jgi:sugar phosphate isomerase/epimerase
MNAKLALSGRLFERDYRDNVPLQVFAKIASDIGYQGVELRKTQVNLETPTAEVKECARILGDHGLEVVCMTPRGYPVLEDEALFIRYLELAAALDCRLIKMGDGGGAPERTRRCAEIAGSCGIRIGLNNHIGTEKAPNCTETIEGTVAYLEKMNHANFGILYDACHLFISGSDYGPKAIEKLKDKIFYVLFQYVVETGIEDSDLSYHGRHFRSGMIGEANGPDFTAVLAGLKQIDYGGFLGVIAPMHETEPPAQTARTYYRKLSELLAQ